MLFGDNLLDFADPKQPTAQSRDELIQNIKMILAKIHYFPKSYVW